MTHLQPAQILHRLLLQPSFLQQGYQVLTATIPKALLSFIQTAFAQTAPSHYPTLISRPMIAVWHCIVPSEQQLFRASLLSLMSKTPHKRQLGSLAASLAVQDGVDQWREALRPLGQMGVAGNQLFLLGLLEKQQSRFAEVSALVLSRFDVSVLGEGHFKLIFYCLRNILNHSASDEALVATLLPTQEKLLGIILPNILHSVYALKALGLLVTCQLFSLSLPSLVGALLDLCRQLAGQWVKAVFDESATVQPEHVFEEQNSSKLCWWALVFLQICDSLLAYPNPAFNHMVAHSLICLLVLSKQNITSSQAEPQSYFMRQEDQWGDSVRHRAIALLRRQLQEDQTISHTLVAIVQSLFQGRTAQSHFQRMSREVHFLPETQTFVQATYVYSPIHDTHFKEVGLLLLGRFAQQILDYEVASSGFDLNALLAGVVSQTMQSCEWLKLQALLCLGRLMQSLAEKGLLYITQLLPLFLQHVTQSSLTQLACLKCLSTSADLAHKHNLTSAFPYSPELMKLAAKRFIDDLHNTYLYSDLVKRAARVNPSHGLIFGQNIDWSASLQLARKSGQVHQALEDLVRLRSIQSCCWPNCRQAFIQSLDDVDAVRILAYFQPPFDQQLFQKLLKFGEDQPEKQLPITKIVLRWITGGSVPHDLHTRLFDYSNKQGSISWLLAAGVVQQSGLQFTKAKILCGSLAGLACSQQLDEVKSAVLLFGAIVKHDVSLVVTGLADSLPAFLANLVDKACQFSTILQRLVLYFLGSISLAAPELLKVSVGGRTIASRSLRLEPREQLTVSLEQLQSLSLDSDDWWVQQLFPELHSVDISAVRVRLQG